MKVKAFLFSFLGIVVGVLVLILLLALWFRFMLNRFGFRGKSLSSIYREAMRLREENAKKHKQVSSLTSVLLPTIQKDFPDFSEEQFYEKTEETIRYVLQSLENLDTKKLEKEDFSLIKDKIQLQVEDLKDSKVRRTYDDIIFHKHAIKSYKKFQGMVKLIVSSSLEYFYEEKVDDKVVVSKDSKKQTRYTTTFVYIYDTKKAGFDARVLGFVCPSCGAPIEDVTKKHCKYCHSGIHLQIANLTRCWKVIELTEDY